MVVTEESVLRRFHDLDKHTKENVEILAMWIIHYKDKASIDMIVDVWQRCFLTSSDAQRITLFYVMNHAVQSARAKNLDYVISAFQPAVLASIPLGRSSSEVRNVIERCLDLFETRQVFTKASVATMKCILERGDAADPVGGLEFNHAELCNKIEAFDKARYVTENLVKHLDGLKKSCDQLKANPRDRQHAFAQMKDAEVVLNSIVAMRHSMETQKKKQLELVESLVLAQRFLGNTFNDAISVDNAYQSYYQSLKNVQKELMDMERTGIYPAATPPRDAPSPTANDDILVENVFNNLGGPARRANETADDMDVDDDEPEPAPVIPFPMDFSMPPPIRPVDPSTTWPANHQPLASPGVPHNYGLPPPIIPTTPQAPPNLTSPSALPKSQLISPPPLGQPPSDPRQAYQMGQPSVYNVPPPSISIPPPQLNQPPPTNFVPPPLNQSSPANIGQGALRDPRQVNQQRVNNIPPPRAPYNMPQETGNANMVPSGARDAAPGDVVDFRAPYKQDPTTSAIETAPYSHHPTETPSSHRDGFQRGDHDREHESNGSWRNDDRHGGNRHNNYGRYDDRRGRNDDRDRRNWDRDRGDGWNRRDSGDHRHNDNRRDRGSYSRDRNRNGYGGDRGYRGRDGYGRGSHT